MTEAAVVNFGSKNSRVDPFLEDSGLDVPNAVTISGENLTITISNSVFENCAVAKWSSGVLSFGEQYGERQNGMMASQLNFTNVTVREGVEQPQFAGIVALHNLDAAIQNWWVC